MDPCAFFSTSWAVKGQTDAGPIAALKKGGLKFTPRLFGTLVRISNPKPMVIHHSQLIVPEIWSVFIRRAAQMSEQRYAQSQRSQSKWTQIDGPNCTVRPQRVIEMRPRHAVLP